MGNQCCHDEKRLESAEISQKPKELFQISSREHPSFNKEPPLADRPSFKKQAGVAVEDGTDGNKSLNDSSLGNFLRQNSPEKVYKMYDPSPEAQKILDQLGEFTQRDNPMSESFPSDNKVHYFQDTNSTYIGQFLDGERIGLGTEISDNGEVYSGNYKGDKRHGKGRLILETGDYLEGEFKYGLPDGHGVYKETNGYTYIGEFRDGKKHGHGVENRPDGSAYEGDFLNDMMHGKGTWTFADGSKYIGEFAHSKIHGNGKYFYPPGDKFITYDGDYDNGIRHGYGVLVMTSGWIYDGEFTNDRLTGEGELTIPGKGKFKGNYVDGKRHGVITYTRENGKVTTSKYENGKKI